MSETEDPIDIKYIKWISFKYLMLKNFSFGHVKIKEIFLSCASIFIIKVWQVFLSSYFVAIIAMLELFYSLQSVSRQHWLETKEAAPGGIWTCILRSPSDMNNDLLR